MNKSNYLPQQRQIPFSLSTFVNPNHMNVNPAEKDNKETRLAIAIAEVISHYNKVTGRNVGYSSGRHKIIQKRLKDGYTVEDFNLICDYKYQEWKDDDKMKKYIEIETFLREEHIQKYLERAKEWKNENKQSKKGLGDFFANKGPYTR